MIDRSPEPNPLQVHPAIDLPVFWLPLPVVVLGFVTESFFQSLETDFFTHFKRSRNCFEEA